MCPFLLQKEMGKRKFLPKFDARGRAFNAQAVMSPRLGFDEPSPLLQFGVTLIARESRPTRLPKFRDWLFLRSPQKKHVTP